MTDNDHDDAHDDDEDLGSVAAWPSLPALRLQASRLASLRSPRVGFERDGVPVRATVPARWLESPAS